MSLCIKRPYDNELISAVKMWREGKKKEKFSFIRKRSIKSGTYLGLIRIYYFTHECISPLHDIKGYALTKKTGKVCI